MKKRKIKVWKLKERAKRGTPHSRPTKSVHVDLRCTVDERNKWQLAAEAEGMPLSMWARRALKRSADQEMIWATRRTLKRNDTGSR